MSLRNSSIKRQRGWLVFEAGLAILLSVAAAAVAIKAQSKAQNVRSASTQAEVIQNVAQAANNLVGEFYASYQAGLPVTKNGVTLPCTTASCEAQGEARTPTMTNLRAMGVGLTPNGSLTANYKSLDGANFITSIRRIPAGCELIPDPSNGALNGSTCNVDGMVCVDKPVQLIGAAVGITDDVGLGAMITKIGADGGFSTSYAPTIITGYDNMWQMPNPFAGTPSGIVCVRFGFGSAALSDFLRMHETRDPDFKNNVTIGGNVIVTTGTVGTGTGTSGAGVGCRLGEILNSGAFFSRSAACINRAWVDGVNGEVGVADAAGIPRAQLKDTGEIISKNAAGTVQAGFTYTGAQSFARADVIQTNAGTAGLRQNGEAFGDTLVINTAAAVGGACPTNNALVWGNGSNSLKVLKCVSNVWALTGTVVGGVGGACPTNGQIGETPANVSVICVNNVWQTVTSRMGNWAVSSTLLVGHGNVVTKPLCEGASVPKLIQIPKAINAAALFVNFDAQDNGTSWTILMVDGENNPAYSTSLAQVGCWYN